MDNGKRGREMSGSVYSQWQTVREHVWEIHTAVLLAPIIMSQAVCNTYPISVNIHVNNDRGMEKGIIEKAKQFATTVHSILHLKKVRKVVEGKKIVKMVF